MANAGKKTISKKLFYPTFLLPCLTLLISSCDCQQNVSGIVLDRETHDPIDSAYVQKVDRNYVHNYTDNKGNFELSSISGGIRKCPPMNVAITKKGYEIKVVAIENSGRDTIYLESIGKKY